MNTSPVHDDDRVNIGQTPEQEVRDFLSASPKGRSSTHGNLYHGRLALMAILRAYRTYLYGALYAFIVAVEVNDGGKFDDLVYFYKSPQGNGTLFIQAKHKQDKGFKITREALCTDGDAKSAYAIPIYFTSFLEIHQNVPNNSRFVLCTNAVLHHNIKRFFKTIQRQQDGSLQVFEDIEAICYQFNSENPFPNLTDKLRDSCLAKLGKKLASIVSVGKEGITFNEPLVNTLADFLYECIEQLTAESFESSVSVFRFKKDFLNAAESTPKGKFREAFRKEYAAQEEQKQNSKQKQQNATPVPPIRLRKLKIQIDRDSFTSARNTGNACIFAKLNQKIDEFYSKFVLVCNSLSEADLPNKAMTLLPQWCDAEREVVLKVLHLKLHEAMNSLKTVPFDLKKIQNFFTDNDLKQNIRNLKHDSGKYLDSLYKTHPHIEVRQERLETAPLYAFLTQQVKWNKSEARIYEFNSSLDLKVSCRILAQILSLIEYETVYINSAAFRTGQELRVLLNDLLSYLKDVNHLSIKVTTIIGKHHEVSIDELMELSKKYHQMIVVVGEKMETNEHLEQFFGKDLTDDSWRELFETSVGPIFGTATQLSEIVDKQDDMSLLQKVLKSVEKIREHHLNKHNYEAIQSWYVQRHVDQENKKHDSLFSKKIVESIIVSQSKESDPPVIRDSDRAMVYIFLNDAGHGKSCYFTWLAWRLSCYDPSLYVVKFIAVEYSTDFDDLLVKNNINSLDYTGIVKLLYRYIHLALFVPRINSRSINETNVDRANARRCAELITVSKCGSKRKLELTKAEEKNLKAEELVELRLFRMKFNERKLVLVFDGFDEIAPDYKDVVMQCFARFVKLDGVLSLYLSSRPYGFKEDLENTFNGCKFYELALFSREDIVLSWHKFLRDKLDGYKNYEMGHCADVLLALYENTSKQLKDIVTVPLMLHMVQTILLPDIKTGITYMSQTISFNALDELNFDMCQLVKRFVTMKLEILQTDKSCTTDSAGKTKKRKKDNKEERKRTKKRHILLAMYVIFNKKDREQMLLQKEQKRGPELIKKVVEGDEETGLVLGAVDGIPRFVHRIFAEYFAARWLFNNRGRFKNESIFKSQTIWSYTLEQTRYFFDSMLLSEGCDLHRAFLNRSWEQVENIFCNNTPAITATDEGGRLPVHLAPYKFLDKLLKTMPANRINDRDELLGWNALDYTFAMHQYNEAQLFLSNGAEPNLDILFDQVICNSTEQIFELGITYVNNLEEHEHLAEKANKLCERVVNHLINEKKVDIFSKNEHFFSLSMLEYCVQMNSVSMLNQLIIKSGKQSYIFETLSESLLQLSYEEEDETVENYLWEHCIPYLNNMSVEFLNECGKNALVNGKEELFKNIFHALCIRKEIPVVADNDTEQKNVADDDTDEYDEGKAGFDEDCCLVIDICDSSSIASDDEKDFLARWLARVVEAGSLHLTSYIVENTNININIETIELLGECIEGNNHQNSIPAFEYLLRKFDLRKDGPSLFESIVKKGCLYMLPCLFSLDFRPEQINAEFLTMLLDSPDRRIAKLFQYLNKQAFVNFYDLSTRLVTASGQQEHNFYTLYKPLFDVALEEELYYVACCLLEHGNSFLKMISSCDLIACGKDAIEENHLEIFRKIFHELCFRYNIKCVEESSISVENDDQNENGTQEAKSLKTYVCCLRKCKAEKTSTTNLQIELLAKSVEAGSLQLTSYIVQKTALNINIETIDLLGEYIEGNNHLNSIPAFEYLLGKFDLGKDGPSLFESIVKKGCLYMLPCLFSLDFRPEQINVKCLTDLMSEEVYYPKRTIDLFAYLHQTSLVHFFKPFKTGASLFDIAIKMRRYVFTLEVFEAAYRNESREGKRNVLIALLGEDRALEINRKWNAWWFFG